MASLLSLPKIGAFWTGRTVVKEALFRLTTARLSGYHRWVLILVILIVFLLLSVGTIRTKLPFSDEAWYADPAFNLATHGSMGTTVLESAGVPRLQGVHEHTYWEMPLYIVTEAGWFRMVGFGLIRQRLMSSLWGVLLLTSWMMFLAKLFDDWNIALLTGGLLAVDEIVVTVGSVGRTDMMCAALGCAALASYVCLREDRLSRAVLVSQTLVVASGMTHPNGLLYFEALLLTSLWFDRNRLSFRYVGLAALPYATGAFLWGRYIAEDPSDFRAQFGISAAGRLGGAISPWAAVKGEIVSRYLGTYWFGSGPQSSGFGRLRIIILVAYVMGVGGAWLVPAIRKPKPVQLLLILTGLTFLSMVVYEGAKESFYLILILPYFAALLAACFLHYRAKRPVLVVIVIFCAVSLNLASIVHLAQRNDFRLRYLPAVRYLERKLPDNGTLMGGAELGYALGFDRVIDDYKLGYDSGKRANLLAVNAAYEEWRETIRIQRPEVDRYIQNTLSRDYDLVFDFGAYQIYAPVLEKGHH
jgi:hypothetical protein